MDVSAGLSLVQLVIEKLGSPISTRIEGLLGLESQLLKLKKTMSTIEAVLRDAEVEERVHQGCRSYVECDKLRRLKEALCQADDLVDEIATLANRKKLMPCNRKWVCNEVCLFFSRHNQFCSALTWSQEMKKILEMLDDIVKDHRHELGSRSRPSVGFDAKQMRINQRETHSFLDEKDNIIGREDDEREVIEKLLNNNTSVEQQDAFVVSIVGIGGLGKTSLAKKVYNDGKIEKKYPQRLWVCVSEDFTIKPILGRILAAVDQEIKTDNNLSLEVLQEKLRTKLDGKKYLLVLDDVWNEDSNKWLELKNVLIGGGRVSSIIVTTRSKKVADVVGSHWTLELKGLSEDASLKLFTKMALIPEKCPMKPELVETAKAIVEKCAYVPLAVRVVGSLLRDQDESKWKNLKDSDLENIIQDESNDIVPVLKISYYYLPFHLKSCFSYCAIFPKDATIIKEDLICLWMAQGFIIPSDGESFEDAGDRYFKQLLQRCFFQDIEVAEGTDDIVSCKMHDLVHDLAKEVAGTDILSCSARCFNENTHHVYLDRSTPEDLLSKLTKMGRMRTCLYDQLPFSFGSLVVEVSKMKYLRVLRLNHAEWEMLPSGIGELVHLRYLDLSYNRELCQLPSSITKLYNLQTLKLCCCRSLERLPRESRKLVNLRHLDISGCEMLTHMPPGMNNMASLQKLTTFVVSGSGRGRSNAAWNWRTTDVGQLEDLDDFINHSHTMEIIVKGGVRNIDIKGGRRMLSKSQELWRIIYRWKTKENYNAEELLQGLQPHSNLAEELLQGLQPHSNLRKLELWGYPGVMFPKWNLQNCLPNLVEIKIYCCEKLEHLPLMSQLLHLKDLELEYMSEVEYMENNTSGDVFFPSLEKLKLNHMSKLKGLWMSKSDLGHNETQQAPKLSHLVISHCSDLTTLFPVNGTLASSLKLKSCLPNLVKIKIHGCQKLGHLPMMSQLLHLKDLELEDMSEVEYMENNTSGDDNGDELVFFPSLEKLKLKQMSKLKGLWMSKSESGHNETQQAPKLSHLVISHCSDLITLFPGPEINGVLGSSMNLKSCLPHLVKIQLSHCKKLEHLPLMSQLRHLKVLTLDDLNEVEYMENYEDGDELVFFPSLEKLMLRNMPKLKAWWKSSFESGKGGTREAAVLSDLYIMDCPELTTIPLCPKLEKLELFNFNKALVLIMMETNHDMSSSSSHCNNNNNNNGQKNKQQHQEGQWGGRLREVEIAWMESLTIKDDMEMLCRSGRLSSLRSLVIRDYHKLKSISAGRGVWEHFTALESLKLEDLTELELEDEDDVSNSSNDESREEGSNNNNKEGSSAAEMPWRYLAPTLRSLVLNELPKVVKLPKGIGCLSSLQSLKILSCDNLESLTPSIGGLSSLKCLDISSCPKLKTMPEEMRHLNSLTELVLYWCSPELKKRCEKHTGIYWPYIQHIPNITVESLLDLNRSWKNCFGQS